MKRTRQERLRLGVFFVIMGCFFVVVIARLFHLQVVLADDYGKRVQKQSGTKVSIPPKRGIIFDRCGNVVATNVFLSSLYAYPETKEELSEVSQYLEKTFSLSKNTAKKKYGLAKRRFRWIKRKISDKFAAKIEADAPRGLYLRKEAKRDYPYGSVGKQIIGFTSIDNEGQAGFEYSFDSVLGGQNGWADVRRDGLNNTFRVKEKALVKPVPGQSVVLTIDFKLQESVEEELKYAVEKYNAKSAMAAFINVRNGDILAMAHFDPEEKNPNKPIKLRVITDQFEPGSIFKVFPAASILDKGMVNFSDTTFCEQGIWKLGRSYLHDDKKLEWLTFRQIIELSSNIGIAKFSIDLGGEEILETAKQFGFGQKLLNCLPGETSGKMSAPPTWSDYNTAALAIGHSIAVSTLQMTTAMGAIANGGNLIKPRLVLGYVDANGYVIDEYDSREIRTVMKRSSSDSLIAFLRGVVEQGTAEPANSKVVNIAGKTGTAQIFDLENRRYFRSKFMASFAGFFPAEDPLVAGVVVVEEPQPIHYGGWTAGPTFRKIAEQYAVLNPDLFSTPDRLLSVKSDEISNTIEIPNFIGQEIEVAVQEIDEKGIAYRSNADEGVIVWQFPSPDRLLFKDDELILVIKETVSEKILMPDLRGLSIREVSAFSEYTGINLEIKGKGRVVKQSIRSGTELVETSTCRINCRPL